MSGHERLLSHHGHDANIDNIFSLRKSDYRGINFRDA